MEPAIYEPNARVAFVDLRDGSPAQSAIVVGVNEFGCPGCGGLLYVLRFQCGGETDVCGLLVRRPN